MGPGIDEVILQVVNYFLEWREASNRNPIEPQVAENQDDDNNDHDSDFDDGDDDQEDAFKRNRKFCGLFPRKNKQKDSSRAPPRDPSASLSKNDNQQESSNGQSDHKNVGHFSSHSAQKDPVKGVDQGVQVNRCPIQNDKIEYVNFPPTFVTHASNVPESKEVETSNTKNTPKSENEPSQTNEKESKMTDRRPNSAPLKVDKDHTETWDRQSRSSNNARSKRSSRSTPRESKRVSESIKYYGPSSSNSPNQLKRSSKNPELDPTKLSTILETTTRGSSRGKSIKPSTKAPEDVTTSTSPCSDEKHTPRAHRKTPFTVSESSGPRESLNDQHVSTGSGLNSTFSRFALAKVRQCPNGYQSIELLRYLDRNCIESPNTIVVRTPENVVAPFQKL